MSAAGVVGIMFLAAALVGCSSTPRAPVPPDLAPFVDAGRKNLERHAEGLPLRSFHFLAARCTDDGGLIVLFEQSNPFGTDGVAYALSGNPQAGEKGEWAGGFAPVDPATDQEITYFLKDRREVPCEAP